MKIFYDKEVDALYLQLDEGAAEGVSELKEGVNLDLSSDGKLVGIEILEASQKLNLNTFLHYNLEFEKEAIGF